MKIFCGLYSCVSLLVTIVASPTPLVKTGSSRTLWSTHSDNGINNIDNGNNFMTNHKSKNPRTHVSKRADSPRKLVTQVESQIKDAAIKMKSFVTGATFDYQMFILVKGEIGASLFKAKESTEAEVLPERINSSLTFVQYMYDEMSHCAISMNRWKSRQSSGASEIFQAFNLVALCLSMYDNHGKPDLNLPHFATSTQNLYDSVYMLSNRFHNLGDKTNTDVFGVSISKAFSLVSPLRKALG